MIPAQTSPAPSTTIDDGCLAIVVRGEQSGHVVEISGDLDGATADAVVQACSTAGLVHVVLDLAGLMFMDSAGYRAVVASRSILRARGGSLSLRGAHGEPQRLLSLIEQLDPSAM